jgi:hypothetical protein
MEFEFSIVAWAAYAAGLTDQQKWMDWAGQPPQLPRIDAQASPALTEMPAMMRRRLNHLGRFACQVAWWCQKQPDSAPMVFASRYGDSERSLGLLGDLVQGQPLSPTAFSLSVHNAYSALYGISRGHTGNTVAVCAGRATVGAALTEAVALLADGAPEVLVVFYEAPLPEHYTVFQDESNTEYAWCLRVANSQRSLPRIRVTVGLESSNVSGEMTEIDTTSWPSGLTVLRHLLRQMSDQDADSAPTMLRSDQVGTQWTWGVHV